MPFSPRRRVSFLPENPRLNKERFGADLAQGRYADIKSPRHRSTRILERANICGPSTLGQSSRRVYRRGGKSLWDTRSWASYSKKNKLAFVFIDTDRQTAA